MSPVTASGDATHFGRRPGPSVFIFLDVPQKGSLIDQPLGDRIALSCRRDFLAINQSIPAYALDFPVGRVAAMVQLHQR